MSYFEFPHTRDYEGDLGYIIKKLEELSARYNNFFEYNSIKFHDPLEWNIKETYPAFNIVYDVESEALYIAKTAVPAGIDIDNTDYWLLVSSFKIDTTLSTESINPVANRTITTKLIDTHEMVVELNNQLLEEMTARTEGQMQLDAKVDQLEEGVIEIFSARVLIISSRLNQAAQQAMLNCRI